MAEEVMDEKTSGLDTHVPTAGMIMSLVIGVSALAPMLYIWELEPFAPAPSLFIGLFAGCAVISVGAGVFVASCRASDRGGRDE